MTVMQRTRGFALGALAALAGLGTADQATAQQGTGSIAGQVTARPASAREGVVVQLVGVRGAFRPPAAPVDLDQRGMRFVPKVVAVLRGTTVRFRNSDNVRHNVFSPDGEGYNLGTWPQGETRAHTFARAGVFRQLCNVHPEMEGYIVVVDNPHFAVTGPDGRFRIDGVPPGSYTLRTWGARLAETTAAVTVTAGGTAEVALSVRRP